MVRSCLALAAVVVLVGGRPASAQDASPAAGPVVPEPAECRVAPRTVDEIAALVGMAPPPMPGAGGEDGGDVAAEAGSPVPFALPAGEPADAETAAAIDAMRREAVACRNAGDLLRFYAFLSDDQIRRRVSPLTAEEAAALAEPPLPVPPAEREAFRPSVGLTVLADGRVGRLAHDEGDVDDYVFYKEVGGRWVIDEDVVDVRPIAATPEAGTPAP